MFEAIVVTLESHMRANTVAHAVGIDEKTARRGHDHITLFDDRKSRRVLFASLGRRSVDGGRLRRGSARPGRGFVYVTFVVDAYVFTDLAQVREITDDWLRIYNEERLHRSLGRVTPAMFRERIDQPGAKF